MKRIPQDLKNKVEVYVRITLRHARKNMKSSDNFDMSNTRFYVLDYHYCEAMGIFEGLRLAGYGVKGDRTKNGIEYGFDQPEQNLTWWMTRIEDQVLNEEE